MRRSFFGFTLLIFATFCISAFDSLAESDGMGKNGVEENKEGYALFDKVILNARVIDPDSGRDESGLNIGIIGETIEVITNDIIEGKNVIDAGGRVVSPGFIDVLSYNPTDYGMDYKIYDGVTTNLALHGGSVKTKSWYNRYSNRGVLVNFGSAFFYNRARIEMGLGFKGIANKEHIEKFKKLAVESLKGGALAIAMSMEYAPGTSREEVRAMMEVAAHFNVPMFFHLRYSDMEEPGTNFDALKEVLDLASQTGASIHIGHINSTGGTFSMGESLRMVAGAIEDGVFVTACTYPYNFWATYLNSARYGKGWEKKFRIGYSDLQLGGSDEILTEESFKKYQKLGKLAIAYAMPDADIRDGLKFPLTMIGSDGVIQTHLNNHPRGGGAFARTIAEYVYGAGQTFKKKEGINKGTLTLMEAIEKMTILPAKRLEAVVPSLQRRGRVQVGMVADLLVFDPLKVRDRASVKKPNQFSEGFDYVMIGGHIVKDENGINKVIKKGQPIKNEIEKNVFETYKNIKNKQLKKKEFFSDYWKKDMDGRQIN